MKTIHKYEILPVLGYEIRMPKDSKVLSVAFQDASLMVWAEIETNNEMETRVFLVFGTGHEIPDDNRMSFIGTTFLEEMVFHVYERRTVW